jgi:hypothetical protein
MINPEKKRHPTMAMKYVNQMLARSVRSMFVGVSLNETTKSISIFLITQTHQMNLKLFI